jgi:hypothetical protein
MAVYESLALEIRDERDVPRAREISYRCGVCEGVVPSQPNDSCGCRCRNIFIDADYVRLVVRDWTKFTVVRQIAVD